MCLPPEELTDSKQRVEKLTTQPQLITQSILIGSHVSCHGNQASLQACYVYDAALWREAQLRAGSVRAADVDHRES